ncbi:MAG: hypothetical protein AAFR36_04250 [Bacteroidota bacterium]
MIRTILSIAVLFCSIFLLAQKSTYFSVVGGAEYLFRVDQRTYISTDEDPHRHFRLGVNYDRRFAEKWWFVTGFRLTHFRFDTGEKDPPTNFGNVPKAFGDTDLTLADYAAGYRWRITDLYAEIPFSLRYFPTTKGSFYLEGGAAVNFYLTTFSRMDLGSRRLRSWSRDSSGSFDQLLPSVQIGAGWQWQTDRNQYLIIQPKFRYFFPFYNDFSMFSGGVEIGYRW